MKKNIARLIKKTSHLHRFFLPVTFAVLVCVAYTLHLSLLAFTQTQTIHSVPFSLSAPTEYPLLTSKNTPQISAEAALVMDADSQVVVYSKNPRLRFSPASTTKLMTALTAFQYFHPADILEIKSSNVEPVVVGFQEGQKVRFSDILYGMLVPSGNDAALAISQNYPGGEAAFVDQMNRNARLFHLFNTHYGDPIGLTDDSDYTTVVDLARLTTIALANPTIHQIVGTKYTTISTLDGTSFSLENTNILLGEDGVMGVKTGYTEGAREVLVTAVVRGNHTFIIVVMRSDDRFADTKTLINNVVDNVTFVPIRP
ncbi:MAG: D-alanyl-D-alanine carboxypeptidase [Patescibacteria group bacterium]|nr:D-alanyl-D-alanine carboxypeptidase [Patescibacteria group bacterium]MDE2589379.1 D-alanyl-D-alanine carboxypeptidase [Patescibacteria group bacterium]